MNLKEAARESRLLFFCSRKNLQTFMVFPLEVYSFSN
jgi:YHS domain-containing protein